MLSMRDYNEASIFSVSAFFRKIDDDLLATADGVGEQPPFFVFFDTEIILSEKCSSVEWPNQLK